MCILKCRLHLTGNMSIFLVMLVCESSQENDSLVAMISFFFHNEILRHLHVEIIYVYIYDDFRFSFFC